MKRAGILTAACLAMMMNSVAICVPYQLDSHTLHLYHFDGNALDSATTNSIHLTLDSGATVTEASLAGLGQALSTYEGTASTNVNLPSAMADSAKAISNFVGADGSGSSGRLFIDEIRLYPGSGTTVTPADPGTTGLVAHYTFDGNAQDSAGGHHGTPVGSPGYAAGKIGQALNMTADGQYVTVAYADDLAMGSFTVAAWVNVADTTASRGILRTRFNSQYTFDLKVEATRVHGDIGDGAAWINTELNIVAAQGGAIGSGVWRHIACVVDGDTGGIRMYLDGTSASTTTCAGTPLFMKPDQELRIGNCYGTEFLHGMIDDVRLYNRVLSDAEVAGLAGRTGPIYEGL